MIPVKVAISGQPGTGKTKTVLRIAKMIEDKFSIGGLPHTLFTKRTN